MSHIESEIQSNRSAIVIGGTGATGRQLIKQLLLSNKWSNVTSIGRRPILNSKKNVKLKDIVIESLQDMSSTIDVWEGNDVFFNCIGTTRQRAGSAREFVNIEVGISMEAAKLAAQANIPYASIISAKGANYKQKAVDWIHPLLYIRTMGQKEQSLIINKFNKVSIFRPGMLIRLMDSNTWIETFLESRGFGLRVDYLASAMIRDVESHLSSSNKTSPKYYIGNNVIKAIIKKRYQ